MKTDWQQIREMMNTVIEVVAEQEQQACDHHALELVGSALCAGSLWAGAPWA